MRTGVKVLRGALLAAILLGGGSSALPGVDAEPAQPGAPGWGAAAPAQPEKPAQPAQPAAAPEATPPASPQEAGGSQPWTTRRRRVVMPGVSLGVPTAWGRDTGQGAVWAGVQAGRAGGDPDAALGVVFGIGNRRHIAADLGLNFLSVSKDTGGTEVAGARGSFNLKVHRILPAYSAVAVGVQNAFTWGGTDAPTNYYLAFSKMLPLKQNGVGYFSRMYITMGVQKLAVGSWQGALSSVPKAVIDRGGELNPFGSVAFKLAEPLNVFAEWTGQNLDLGFSFVPIPSFPLVITPGVIDVAGSAGGESRFLVGVGMPFTF